LLALAGGLGWWVIWGRTTPADRQTAVAEVSPLDQLDPLLLPPGVRKKHPAELVALLGKGNLAANALAWSPDGSLLVIGSGNSVRLWQAAASDEVIELGADYPGPVSAIAFTPDGKTFAVGGGYDPKYNAGGWLQLWHRNAGTIKAGPSSLGLMVVKALAFSPDGKTLAVGGQSRPADASAGEKEASGCLQLWRLSGGQLKKETVLEQGPAPVTALAFAPNGETLAAGYTDRKVCLWNTSRSRLRNTVTQIGAWLLIVALLALCLRLWRGGGRGSRLLTRLGMCLIGLGLLICLGIRLWSARNDQFNLRATLPDHAEVTGLAFSADSQTLATSDSRGGAYLWDLNYSAPRKQPPSALPGHAGRVVSLAFSPRGSRLASADNEGRLLVTKTSSKATLWKCQASEATGHIALAPDDRHLAAINHDGTVSILRFGGNAAVEKALAEYGEVLKKNPKDVATLVRRGQRYLREGRHEDALKDLSHAVALDPRCIQAYWLRSLVFRLQGAGARAIADLDEVIRLNPRDALAYHQRGLLHADKDDYARAKSDLEEALKLDPSLAEK
jgi:WD40 repeat protein